MKDKLEGCSFSFIIRECIVERNNISTQENKNSIKVESLRSFKLIFQRDVVPKMSLSNLSYIEKEILPSVVCTCNNELTMQD